MPVKHSSNSHCSYRKKNITVSSRIYYLGHKLIFFVSNSCLDCLQFVVVSFFLPWFTQASLITRLTSLVSTANQKGGISQPAKPGMCERKPVSAHARHIRIHWPTRLTSKNSANAASQQLKGGRCTFDLPNCTSGIPLVQVESTLNSKCFACSWKKN